MVAATAEVTEVVMVEAMEAAATEEEVTVAVSGIDTKKRSSKYTKIKRRPTGLFFSGKALSS